MSKFDAERNPKPISRALARPANCNRQPHRWQSLEEGGIQPAYVGGVAELASALACYAETREDRTDIKGAVGLLLNVRDRMERRRAGEAGRLAHV